MGLYSGGFIIGLKNKIRNWWAYYRGGLYTGGPIFGVLRYVRQFLVGVKITEKGPKLNLLTNCFRYTRTTVPILFSHTCDDTILSKSNIEPFP